MKKKNNETKFTSCLSIPQASLVKTRWRCAKRQFHFPTLRRQTVHPIYPSCQCNYDKQTSSRRVISDAMNQPFHWPWRLTSMNLNCARHRPLNLRRITFLLVLLVQLLNLLHLAILSSILPLESFQLQGRKHWVQCQFTFYDQVRLLRRFFFKCNANLMQINQLYQNQT